MKDISINAALPKPYTNHATAISNLERHFQDADVATVSGHKPVSSMSMYKRTSLDKKQQMFNTLHDALHPLPTTSPIPTCAGL